MQPEKWQQTKDQIKETFSGVEVIQEKLTAPQVGEKETLIFNSPLGRMKLEYLTRPVVLEKKTLGSRRIGSHTAVEYVYAPDQFSYELKAYKWDEETADWLAIDFKQSFKI